MHVAFENSASIASGVEGQGAATAEIARNVEEAAQGTQDVTRSMSGVSSAAEQTENAAAEFRRLMSEQGLDAAVVRLKAA